jgi:DNA invertase Pin-like site-specific DNA recombinase
MTRSSRKPVAFSYVRWIRPEQAKGDSLRRQTEARERWLADHPDVVLDNTLELTDRGKSAFRRDDWDKYALGEFVKQIGKRVQPGDYLLVENLDRLSREEAGTAVELFLSIVNKGVVIAQLMPQVLEFRHPVNVMSLMFAIVELSRGHSESAAKSDRVGKAWANKRRRAAENGEPMTPLAPVWLRLVDGKWELIAAAADAVRKIFRLAVVGYGLGVITKRLNAAGVPPIGRAKHWARSFVGKILSSRAVVGEFQPYTGRGPRRAKDGKPISNYYPAVVTEAEWYAARAALVSRRRKVGRTPKAGVNVFAHLLHDARDGGTMHITSRGAWGGRYLASNRAKQGVEGAVFASFPFATFERAILSQLREINPRDVLPQEDGEVDRAQQTAGRLAEVRDEIAKMKSKLRARYSDGLADLLAEKEDEEKALLAQQEAAQREAASPLSEAWTDCRSLIDTLDSAPDPEEARVRLRAVIRRVVRKIDVLTVPQGAVRLARVTVYFAGPLKFHTYFIAHRPKQGGAVGTRPGGWAFVAWTFDQADVERVNRMLAEAEAKLEAMRAAGQEPPEYEDPPGTLTPEDELIEWYRSLRPEDWRPLPE